MEGSEWDDERRYPDAPVPAHERFWRHPSELGQQSWALTEPPLTIGRGLTAATGAIGGILALAVLWTMVPTEAGRSVVSARSTVATFAGGSFGLVDTTVRLVTTSVPQPATTSSPPAPSSTVATSPPPTAATDPTPTFQVSQLATATGAAAVAVAVASGELVLTTAIAVGEQESIELRRADGTIEQATVLIVDQATGLALLSPESADGSTSFALGDDIAPGDELTLVDSDASPMTVAIDGEIDMTGWDAADVKEGTAVVNQRGELVGLCSRTSAGTELVTLADLDQLRQQVAATDPTERAWLGIMVNDQPSGTLSVSAVDPAGPAANAGLAIGDAIVAVDGVAVTSSSTLIEIIAAHVPGDIVILSVHRGAATIELPVELGVPKPSL